MIEEVDHSRATTIFVLGLLSLVMCQILGPVALVMGNSYRKECAYAGVEPEGLGTAGWVMGIISSILMVFTFGILLLYFLFICLFVGGSIGAGM
jgi:hypothetical protein